MFEIEKAVAIDARVQFSQRVSDPLLLIKRDTQEVHVRVGRTHHCDKKRTCVIAADTAKYARVCVGLRGCVRFMHASNSLHSSLCPLSNWSTCTKITAQTIL